jgi:hypothetical protein
MTTERRRQIREMLVVMRGAELRAGIREIEFLAIMMRTLDPRDELVRQIRQLGREADGILEEEIEGFMERRRATVIAARRRVN